jgi:hypothetical protein
VWRALILVVVITLSSRVDAQTWIDRGLDRFGVIVFEELNDRQDYDRMISLTEELLASPAFFTGKPMLADVVAMIVQRGWHHREIRYLVNPLDAYRRRADSSLEVAAIHPSNADELLASALYDLYYIRDVDRAYGVMQTLEADYPRSNGARRTTDTRIQLHARRGEFAIAARIAKDFIATARRAERREAFVTASDAMRIWLGLGDVNTALFALDWMTRQQDAVPDAGELIVAAAMLVDEHRLYAIAQR